jgi:hypothetical protein
MIAGGIFALAGLWLMFRPKPEGGAAKVELLGMKFESSSAGLLVFLIGSGFLATPLFVSERTQPATTAPLSSPQTTAPTGAREAAPPPAEGPANADVRSEIADNGVEVEPNDTFAAANSIELGTSVAGSLSGQDLDTFVVAIPPDMKGQIAASLVATKGDVVLTLFDGGGQVVGSQPTYRILNRAASVVGKIQSHRYLAVVGNQGDEDSVYYLTMGVSPD